MTEDAGASIINFDTAAKLRLEGKVRRLTMERDALAQTMRDNHAAMAQIHGAILALIDVGDINVLDQRLGGHVRQSLNADVLRVYVENLAPPPNTQAILGAPDGFVVHVLGSHNEWLGPCSDKSAALFGKQADTMASEALFRLNVRGREGVLALGNRDRFAFKADHGTDLAAFFARAIERLVAAWAPR